MPRGCEIRSTPPIHWEERGTSNIAKAQSVRQVSACSITRVGRMLLERRIRFVLEIASSVV